MCKCFTSFSVSGFLVLCLNRARQFAMSFSVIALWPFSRRYMAMALALTLKLAKVEIVERASSDMLHLISG